MVVNTKCFGEVNITEDKIVTFEHGLFGFESFTKYTILYDNESETEQRISWLQSVEEPSLALPIISPLLVEENYSPSVAHELLESLDELNENNTVMFLVVTVPSDLTKMTANQKAPIIINADTRKGAQVIVDNPEYRVKYNIYEIFTKKEGAAC